MNCKESDGDEDDAAVVEKVGCLSNLSEEFL